MHIVGVKEDWNHFKGTVTGCGMRVKKKEAKSENWDADPEGKRIM